MEPAFSLANVATVELVLVGVVAFAASILGGLSGYGTGLVLPIFLAPVVGVANVIPIMAVGMAINNASRVAAFHKAIEWTHVGRILMLGLPACIAGAYGYTLLEGRTIAFLLGSFLIASVPLRRWFMRVHGRISPGIERAAGAGFGFLDGGMTGTGTVLIAILMAAGVQGMAIIATDAVISVTMGVVKVALFRSLARLDIELLLAGLLIGACTMPGAFVARWLLRHIPARVHTAFMETIVIVGGAGFLWRALRA
jgi:uncharacterized membrane protein YfcA